jgi:hypothetical protein
MKERTLKKRLLPELAVALTAVLLLLSFPAFAGPGVSFHARVKGQFAEAYFDSVDRSGCVESFVYIFAVKDIERETGQPEQGPQASTTVSQTDICSGVPLIDAIGSTSLTEATFQIDKKLNSARLDATFEVCDFISDTCFPIDAHVIWTSSGGPFRLKEHRQIQAAGLKINSRFDGTSREATASGSIADGSIDLRPETSFSVYLRSVKFGEVEILH